MATLDTELWAVVAEEEDGALDERIAEAVENVSKERERLMAARSQVTRAAAVIDKRVQRCNRILKAAGLVEADPRAPRKPREGDAYKRNKISREVAGQIHAVLATLTDGATAPELAEAVGLNVSTVRNAIAALRDDGQIRKAGTRPAKHGVPPIVWKVMSDGNSNGN